MKNVNHPGLDEDVKKLRIMSNFSDNIDWPFQYLFALNVICLIFRITVMLQFSESIGPLVKIVSKMFDDFINFLILYFLLAIMFTTIANLNFIYTLTEFQGLFESFLTITDASLGNFNFEMFEKINDEGMKLFG